jgi:uncharacterized protein YdeI (BOF family)
VVKYWLPLAAGALLAVLTGCVDHKEKTLGLAFEGAPLTVSAAKQTNAGSPVIVRGKMTEKCPVAGCWFMLRDESGTIKVDTKNAGFVVVDVPLQTSLIVGGRVMTNGTERSIDATGVRY